MRIFTRILKIILCIVFVLSVLLNIVLGVSSTTFSLFTNKEKAIKEIYYSSALSLSSEEMTIKSSMPYSLLEGHTSKDEIVCKLNKEGTTPTYECEMISKLYNSESSLVRTSYFPGDGYKYTSENEKYTKTKYDNVNLYNYFMSLVYGASLNLNYLIADSATIDTYSFSYKTGLKFDINTFSLDKKINVSYTESAESKNTIKFTFDAKDRLEYLEDTSLKSTLSISYKQNKLVIPDLVGYSEV